MWLYRVTNAETEYKQKKKPVHSLYVLPNVKLKWELITHAGLSTVYMYQAFLACPRFSP